MLFLGDIYEFVVEGMLLGECMCLLLYFYVAVLILKRLKKQKQVKKTKISVDPT